MLVDTSIGGRILINVPAGAIKVSTEGSGSLPLELREGELREVYLSSLITQR
jgi:hypothetical protein